MNYLLHLVRNYPFTSVLVAIVWVLSLTPFFPETPLDDVKFIDKWGFDVWGYCVPFEEGIRKILSLSSDGKKTLRIIDFTCGLGATAAVIKKLLPASFVAGVCPTPFEAGIASRVADDVAFGDLNSMRLPWEKHSFDVAITEKGLVGKCIISECLKKDGVIISDCSATECAEAGNK